MRTVAEKKNGREPYDGQHPAFVPSYTLTEAATLLSLPRATLRSWVLGQPYQVRGTRRMFKAVIKLDSRNEHLLSFRNLVEVHVLAAIRRVHHIQLPKVRTALRYLSERLKIDHPLAHAQMQTDGKSLLVEQYGKLINATESGQLEMEAIVTRFLKRVVHDDRGLPIRLYPVTRSEADRATGPIVVDPRIQFGRPCLAERGIPTTVVAGRFLAGESVQALARDYAVEVPEIEEALRFEQKLAA
jgi:uncharacterized protein (DUF433 family)